MINPKNTYILHYFYINIIHNRCINIETVFYDILAETRCITLGIAGRKDIVALLKKLLKDLEKNDTTQIKLFVDVHYDAIRKAYKVVKALSHLRSLFDKVFHKHFKIDRQAPLGLTYILEEFIKGITYFADQEEAIIPIYHRLYSCDHFQAFRDKFQQCRPGTKSPQLFKQRIKTCYIERLIYDKMFTDQQFYLDGVAHETERSQDAGHVHWLSQTKEDFLTCFPGLNIDVEIKYFESTMWPKSLTLLTMNNRGIVTSTEIYEKDLILNTAGIKTYANSVDCFRTTTNRCSYFKMQRYVHRSSWRRMVQLENQP